MTKWKTGRGQAHDEMEDREGRSTANGAKEEKSLTAKDAKGAKEEKKMGVQQVTDHQDSR